MENLKVVSMKLRLEKAMMAYFTLLTAFNTNRKFGYNLAEWHFNDPFAGKS